MLNRKGLTLAELMVLILIIGLVTAMAIPSFSRFVRSNQLATSADRLAADLQMARTMSIASGRVYRVAADRDGYRIVDPGTGLVVREHDFEGTVELAAGDTVDFFPWGMAQAANFDLQVPGGAAMRVNLLPTGMVDRP